MLPQFDCASPQLSPWAKLASCAALEPAGRLGRPLRGTQGPVATSWQLIVQMYTCCIRIARADKACSTAVLNSPSASMRALRSATTGTARLACSCLHALFVHSSATDWLSVGSKISSGQGSILTQWHVHSLCNSKCIDSHHNISSSAASFCCCIILIKL